MTFSNFVGQFQFYRGIMSQLVDELSFVIKRDQGAKRLLTIATPNPEQLVQAFEDEKFATTLHKFDYLLPDGVGLVWLSQTKPNIPTITHKIAGVDLVSELLLLSSANSWPVLIIGGKNYAKKIVKLEKTSGEQELSLEIIGAAEKKIVSAQSLKGSIAWLEGYQNFVQPKPAEELRIREVVQQFQPKLVFVALGAPRQEIWIEANRSWLEQAGVKLVMAVGGTFDMLTGALPRAPKFVRQLGLEWLWRLIQQPRRIKRQLRLIKFVWLSLFG